MFAARLSSALTASYELLTRQVCRGTAGISAAPSHDEFRDHPQAGPEVRARDRELVLGLGAPG